MNVSLIAAMDENRVIGKDNDLPWRLPRDWQYVKHLTMGKPIILGRKNFESIGKALPGRKNIVLTRDRDFYAESCKVVHSMEEALSACTDEDEVIIFGGEQIYKMFLPLVTKMFITRIHHAFEGDTFFPDVNYNEWSEISKEKGITDEKNPYSYTFYVYEKK
ncbi:dihydrofolate reductase [Fictibacillus barbaricus]|uniref:Dihydrofolate reductase n=1 Tax=Fictibacillus barbaricus TaxID=182136 RepID=A0ABS2ZAG7_9BACL|nr:dihydrofolate reductase [Fictibacillus barbaricus]MBN3545198.1 dihydrofolate reductase [Fictibacillus barbaricus]GGB60886.1 dihydrofolate reductase [Fictibacillus barbaricus]